MNTYEFIFDHRIRPVPYELIEKQLKKWNFSNLKRRFQSDEYLEDLILSVEAELSQDFNPIRDFILSMQKDKANTFEYRAKHNHLKISGQRTNKFRIRDSFVRINERYGEKTYLIDLSNQNENLTISLETPPMINLIQGESLEVKTQYSTGLLFGTKNSDLTQNPLEGCNFFNLGKSKTFSPEQGYIYYRKCDHFFENLIGSLLGDGSLYNFGKRYLLDIDANISLENKPVYMGKIKVFHSPFPLLDSRSEIDNGFPAPKYEKRYKEKNPRLKLLPIY